MSEYVAVADVDRVPSDRGLSVSVGDRELALFNLGGQFYALDGFCPHRGGPLGEGDIIGNEIVCPWHFWSFDIATGCNSVSAEMAVPTFEVKLEGERILVNLA